MPEIFQHDYPALSCVQACKVYAMQHDYSGPLIYQYDDGTSQTVEVHVDSVVAAKVLTQREAQVTGEPKPSTAPETIEQPEYRLLGEDEVVQAGDLMNAKSNPDQSLMPLACGWIEVPSHRIGKEVSGNAPGLLNFCRKVEPEINHSMAVSMIDDDGALIGLPPTSREEIDRLNEEYEQEKQAAQQAPETVNIVGIDGNPIEIPKATKEAYGRAWAGQVWEHEGVKYRLADERDVGKEVRFRSDVSFDAAVNCKLLRQVTLLKFDKTAKHPYFTDLQWKYVWVPLEEPAQQPEVKPTRWRACKTLSEFEPF